MIYIRDEGYNVRNGINIYPLSSKHFGFVIRWKDERVWQFRYSKKKRMLWIGNKCIEFSLHKRASNDIWGDELKKLQKAIDDRKREIEIQNSGARDE